LSLRGPSLLLRGPSPAGRTGGDLGLFDRASQPRLLRARLHLEDPEALLRLQSRHLEALLRQPLGERVRAEAALDDQVGGAAGRQAGKPFEQEGMQRALAYAHRRVGVDRIEAK